MILYGSPAVTFDWDLWVHPDDRARVFALLVDEMGFEASRTVDDPLPIVSFFAGGQKIDLFFYGAVRDIEGEELSFEEAWAASIEFEDPESSSFRMRVPCLDHLIILKKLRARNLKDEEDIKYLLAIRLDRPQDLH